MAMACLSVAPVEASRKKRLLRKGAVDRSQLVRHAVQWLFVALNVWIGAQFFLWVRYYERGGSGLYVARPAGVDGWLPIAGLINTKYLWSSGQAPTIHPAAMYLFLGFVVMSLLAKKAFCSWLCPVGTLSENLWKLGQRFFGRNFRVTKWVDIPLRGLKYLLLGFFLYIVGGMTTEALEGFMATPYGLIADVKMLNFFRHVGLTALLVLGVLALLSMLVQNFWCRYLCPYGALLGLASVLSPVKIRRDAEACIDCGKCARECPAHLAVDQLVQIRSAECTACMICVAACPAENGLQFSLPPRRGGDAKRRWYHRALGPWAVAGIVAYVFLGAVLVARTTNHWRTDIPREVYMRLVPNANELSHPGF